MFLKLIIAIIIAVISSGFYSAFSNPESQSVYQLDMLAMVSFCSATVLTVLLSSWASCIGGSKGSQTSESGASYSDADRESGTVKWFNVSKGFGFITRENGEDIFVHYRSIRGQGRRRLFDGQSVTFAVIDSDKGLQADDVEAL